MIIDGVGFMVGSPQPGQPGLVSVEAQGISQVAPPDYSYAGDNPLNDREEPFQQLTLGIGLAIQEKWDDQRYIQANAVDLSVWPWMLGPEIVTTTPAGVNATYGITRFFEIITDLYCANGPNVYKKTAGARYLDAGAHLRGADHRRVRLHVEFRRRAAGVLRAAGQQRGRLHRRHDLVEHADVHRAGVHGHRQGVLVGGPDQPPAKAGHGRRPDQRGELHRR